MNAHDFSTAKAGLESLKDLQQIITDAIADGGITVDFWIGDRVAFSRMEPFLAESIMLSEIAARCRLDLVVDAARIAEAIQEVLPPSNCRKPYSRLDVVNKLFRHGILY